MELETSIEWALDHSERIITADNYPGYRVRIGYDHDQWDALDSQAMAAVVKFAGVFGMGTGVAELHTGCGDELDMAAIGQAWASFQDTGKLARWLVMTGQAYAVEIIEDPRWNSMGFLVAATPQWVRDIWVPEGEEMTAEHIAKAKAALHEEGAVIRSWINGDVYSLVPEYLVTVAETVTSAAGIGRTESYEEWRERDDYGPVHGYIGDEYAITEAKDILSSMVADEHGLER